MNTKTEAAQSDLANARLAEFYRPHLESWRSLKRSNRGISVPAFLKTNPSYFAAKPRLLFVGQETHGWWTECKKTTDDLTAEEIMDFYASIRNWLEEKYRRSPYWKALRQITAGLNLSSSSESYLFSNIFPCDVDKRQAPIELHDTFREWRILAGEVRILEPDWIIFFCGPHYAWNLGPYFGEGLKSPITKADPLIVYRPEGHSWRGLATYHPNALQRLQLGWVLDKIIQGIRGGHG